MAHGKRSRQQAETTSVSLMDLDGGDMARILMIFSGHHNTHGHHDVAGPASPERVFECKTCNRRFPSFQALGEHQASHKKPRLADGEPPKPKWPLLAGARRCCYYVAVVLLPVRRGATTDAWPCCNQHK
ncbi:hypothetical protein VPH35_078542 [Triticum aestivum]